MACMQMTLILMLRLIVIRIKNYFKIKLRISDALHGFEF